MGSTVAIYLFVVIPLFLGRIVIVEDYVPRIIADYVYALDSNVKRFLWIIVYWLKLYSRLGPVKRFYLYADYAELMKRRGVCVEPYDYILVQGHVYELLSMVYRDSVVIDTSKNSIIRTLKKIMQNIHVYE